MMTRDYMKQTYADNLTAWREYRAQIAQDAETLCEIVQKHRFGGGTPEQAAREIVQVIGKESACVIIASAVNAHEHDGRLSPEVVKWAQEIGWDWEMSCNLGLTLDAKMHMCHINQTAEAIMNLPETEPEQPETETAEADETETNEQIETEQTTPDGVTYHISENYEYNSREVYFSGKPAAETREALKALKMRWNPKKGCWYGYAAEHEIIAAIQGAELTADPTQGAIVTTDGYMGGGAYYGAKSGANLYGADLAAAIRADIKAAGIKGVTIRCESYSGGETIHATLTIDRADLTEAPTADPTRHYTCEFERLLIRYNYWTVGGEQITCKRFYEMSEAEQTAIALKYHAEQRERFANRQSLNKYHTESEDNPELSAAFLAKVKKVIAIITAYRYDESNSMVDYFNTNFYYDLHTKPGKSWAA